MGHNKYSKEKEKNTNFIMSLLVNEKMDICDNVI